MRSGLFGKAHVGGQKANVIFSIFFQNPSSVPPSTAVFVVYFTKTGWSQWKKREKADPQTCKQVFLVGFVCCNGRTYECAFCIFLPLRRYARFHGFD